MKAKRILALLLAMMMVFMLAACSSDKKEDTSASSSTDSSTSAEKKEEPKKEEKKEEPKKEEKKEEPKKEETAPAAEENENITIECLFSNHDSQPYTEATWLLPKKALEKFNITMNMNAIPSASFEEKKNTTLASGEIPDLVMGVAKSVCDEYGKLGMFMNFMNYIDIMPNMAKIMDEYPTLKAYMPSENEMYAQASQITTAGAVNTACYFIPMIRMDIMNELGLSQWESYDEFYDVLAAMKTKYPDSYPWVNRQGIAFIISVFAPGLGIDSFPSGLSSTGWGVWKEDSKSFTSIMDEPNFKEWVIFMNKLYNDGLLDPSYATDDTQTWESKIVSGAGFFACDYFARPEMMSSIGVTSNANYSLEAMLVPVMEGGSQTIFSRLGIGSWFVADAKTEHPERLCEFIDWWRFTEEGSLLMTYGVEGETFTINPDKTITKIFPAGITNNLDFDAALGCNYLQFWSFRPDFYGYDLYDKDASYHTNQVWELLADKQISSPPTLVFNTEEQDEYAEYSADLSTAQGTIINEFIMGRRDIATWDESAKEMNDAGYADYLELINSIYGRIYG